MGVGNEWQNALGVVLGRILSDLNDKGECYLPLDDANMLSLKLATQLPTPPQVRHISTGRKI